MDRVRTGTRRLEEPEPGLHAVVAETARVMTPPPAAVVVVDGTVVVVAHALRTRTNGVVNISPAAAAAGLH